jgi:hypothetical protein
MPLCTTPPRIATSSNPSCFQFVETGAGDCSISMRSFYDLHLHIRWARFGGPSKSPEGVVIGLAQDGQGAAE